MNNNRQANGRRRGRGGQRSQGGNPNQGNGNRIDNRARGNAAQLLEKYKNLARDAQMQGDRVNTEYYLQFADHYFRVLSETRSRFEEQNRPQRDQSQDGDDEYEFDGEGDDLDVRDAPREQRNGYVNGHANGERYREPRDNREPREAREPRENREPRETRENREPRDNRDQREARDYRERDGRERDNRERESHERDSVGDSGEANEQRGVEVRDSDNRDAGRRNTRGRVNRERREATPEPVKVAEAAPPTDAIDIAVLPPAFGLEGEPIEEIKPRRRGRPRKQDNDAPSV